MIVGCMESPPEGLGLPGLRTEDVPYFQRDGVTHFSDWYTERLVTLARVMVCDDNCGCGSENNARIKLSALMQDWQRSCCDIEAVVYTDCNGQVVVGTPILGPQTVRRNLIKNPSFEESLLLWSVPVDSFCRSYDRCYVEDGGTTWCYSHVIDGAFSQSRGTDGGWVGEAYMRLTCDVVPTSPGIGFTYSPTAAGSPEVAAQTEYIASAYMRASAAQEVVAQILWYDSIGTLLGVSPGSPFTLDDEWSRVSVNATAPDNVDYAHVQWVTTETAWVTGGTLDIDGILFESGHELLDYFDGDTPDIDDPPEVGGQVVVNLWVGAEHNSESVQSSQTYEENIDRSLYGPFGIVGRPRIATYNWVGQGSSCAEVTLRFDSPDQRMYVLDECGTPGYQKCRTVQPGLQQNCRTYDRCYADGGMCYSQPSASSVLPVTLNVGGTQRVFPLIVLYPGLSYPTIENMGTGEFITFNGPVEGEAITIDTENGIATGLDTEASYTHLLGGSIFLSILPGETQFRMFSRGSTDSGEAAICWRDTVISA